MATAADGSSWSRHTEVSISKTDPAGIDARRLDRLLSGRAAASAKEMTFRPPTALPDARKALEEARLGAETLVGVGESLVELVRCHHLGAWTAATETMAVSEWVCVALPCILALPWGIRGMRFSHGCDPFTNAAGGSMAPVGRDCRSALRSELGRGP